MTTDRNPIPALARLRANIRTRAIDAPTARFHPDGRDKRHRHAHDHAILALIDLDADIERLTARYAHHAR